MIKREFAIFTKPKKEFKKIEDVKKFDTIYNLIKHLNTTKYDLGKESIRIGLLTTYTNPKEAKTNNTNVFFDALYEQLKQGVHLYTIHMVYGSIYLGRKV